MGLERREQRPIGDHAALDHLGQPRGVMTIGQRLQIIDVDVHGGRLVEGPDDVLAGRVIDAGLAADRRVHHADERGRHLHVRDAALERGGHEADEVADDPAAQGHQGRVAAGPQPDDAILDLVAHAARLAPFAGREGDEIAGQAAPPEGGLERLPLALQMGVGDDDVALAEAALAQGHGHARSQTAADADVVRFVRPLAQMDRDSDHVTGGSPPAAGRSGRERSRPPAGAARCRRGSA